MNTIEVGAEVGSVDIGITQVSVDPEDVLDKMEVSEIKAYLEDRTDLDHDHNPMSLDHEEYYRDLVNDYHHGDFNLDLFLRLIGKEEILKSLNRG